MGDKGHGMRDKGTRDRRKIAGDGVIGTRGRRGTWGRIAGHGVVGTKDRRGTGR